MTIETITLDLTYAEVIQLLESGTVQEASSIHAKLRAARGAFERQPKVYGNGLSRQFQEPTESEKMQTHKDLEAGRLSTRTIKLPKENK